MPNYSSDSNTEDKNRTSRKFRPRLKGSQDFEGVMPWSLIAINELMRLPSETPTSEEQSEERLKSAQLNFERLFIQSIARSDLDLGFSSEAEQLLRTALSQHGPYVREWINHLFLQLFNKPDEVASVLRVISHLDYHSIHPQGTTMAVAAMMHADTMVKEAAVRCFENWRDKSSVPILESLGAQEAWLQSYVNDVIKDLTTGDQRALFD